MKQIGKFYRVTLKKSLIFIISAVRFTLAADKMTSDIVHQRTLSEIK
jgi:hypothetical protein